MHYAIGIDVGTSACRACALDDTGAFTASARVPLPPPLRSNNEVEQDCLIWREAVLTCLDELCAGLPDNAEVTIAIDGTSSTVALFDAQGNPLSPGLMYNDQRATTAAKHIRLIAPAESGAHGASSSLAKTLYLARTTNRPQVRHCLHQADWLCGCLCGSWGLSDENNALKLGYDILARRWPDWITELGVNPDWLPDVQPPGAPAGLLTPALADRFQLSPRSRVVRGTTDSTAAVIASGAHRPGDAIATLGTTLVFKVISEHPVFDPDAGVYSHRLGHLWLAGGASNSGGAVLDRFFSRDELVRLSAQLEVSDMPDEHYYPLPEKGERFPINDPDLAPHMPTADKSPPERLLAILSGFSEIEDRAWQTLETLGAPEVKRIFSIGGGAANPAWFALRRQCFGNRLQSVCDIEPACGSAHIASNAE